MKLIKDYAKERNISHQAVYKLIENHEVELKDYIVKQGRTRYLLPEAEEILDSYRNRSQIVIEKQDRIDEIERLKAENDQLKNKLIDLQDKMLNMSDQLQLAASVQLLLEDRNKQLDELKAENERLKNLSWWKRLFK